jgi:hypothetical protein
VAKIGDGHAVGLSSRERRLGERCQVGAVTETMISIAAVPEAGSIVFGCLATGVVGLAVAGLRYVQKRTSSEA